MYGILIALLVATLGTAPLLTAGGFVLAALLWFVVYVRPRAQRESALVYMVRGAVATEMHRSELEEELRDIALERDEIVADRFDHLVRNCPVLDVPQACSSEQMFALAAEALAERLGIDRAALERKFRQRETASSTVVRPGLAIPHVVVEGEGLFELLLVRCREGVSFGPDQPPVRAAFVLVGSKDERNYHLRALMAIAHIAQEEDFEDRWLSAGQAQGLRDICLLSDRKRDHPGA